MRGDLGKHPAAESIRLEGLRERKQVLRRLAAQAARRRGRVGATELRRHGGAESLHLSRRPPPVPRKRRQPGKSATGGQVHQRETTLDDRTVKQARRPGSDQVRAGGQSPVRFAEQRHVPGVATERGRVAPDPLQRGLLVLQAECPRALEPGIAEGSEDPQPVVDGDHHHVSDGSQATGVEDVAGPDAPSPWIHTITGLRCSGPAPMGAVTFRKRQSSSTLSTSA